MHSVGKIHFENKDINLSQHRHFALMPTIATMFNSRLPPHSMAGYTTKTVQDRIVTLDFQQMARPRNFPNFKSYNL